MDAQIDLWLLRIDYEGDNIGQNFEIKIRGGLPKLTFSKRIKHNSSATCNKMVYSKRLSSETHAEFRIDIREKDVVPDLGTAEVSFLLNSGKGGSYSFLTIEVEEAGPNNAGKKARMTLTFLEKRYGLGHRTLVETDNDGWIKGRRPSKQEITLPFGLQVSLFAVKSRRECFKILEGHENGKTASLPFAKESDQSRFSGKKMHRPACYIKFNKSQDTVKIKGIAQELKVIIDHSEVLPDGIYTLEIPDVPHKDGRRYLKDSIYAQTWFRIVYPANPKKQYYFHYGRRTEGCVTVLVDKNPIGIWDRIYKLLVLSRNPEGNGLVGLMEVVSE